MVAMAQIEELGRQIGVRFAAEQVILFGSYARGEARSGADVDLLVVMPFEGSRAAQAGAIRTLLHPGYAIDVVLHTPDEVRHRLALGDPFLTEVMHQGKVLYGPVGARVG